MAQIYKVTDRIKVKVGDITLILSPLTKEQKMNTQLHTAKAVKGDMESAMKAVELAVKYSIKGIEGLFHVNDQGVEVPYTVKLEGGVLSDEAINDLMNMELSDKISNVATAFLGGVPSEIKDQKGNKIEGIEVILPKAVDSSGK